MVGSGGWRNWMCHGSDVGRVPRLLPFVCCFRLWVGGEIGKGGGLKRRRVLNVPQPSLSLAELLLRRAMPHFTAVRHARARDDLVLEVERKLTLGDELLEERLDVLREHLARVRWDLGG